MQHWLFGIPVCSEIPVVAKERVRMVVRRPHDRKQQILAAAGELFREHGYHNVSVAQVAAGVGITAPALYRHFKNKPDLLYAAVNAGIESLYDRVAGSEDLKSMIAELAVSVSRRRGLSLLWQREARYLPDEQREEMRATLKSAAARDAALIRTERPELDEEDSYLLAWALIAVFNSVSSHRVSLPRRQMELLLAELAERAVHTELGHSEVKVETPTGHVPLAMPRRELLLTEAIRLFDERGYQAVNTEDIGEAAGTTGPNVYNHFDAKIDLLIAAVSRGGERRRIGVAQALAAASGPEDALSGLLAAHIDFAINERHLIGLLISELDQLPDKFRRTCEQNQREYVALWVKMLDDVRPGLEPATARITVNAALTVVENAVRIGRLRRRDDLPERLFEIGSAVLLGG
ncbi:putative TetR family transcriptional regulator [Rhodococcus erythropolis PR4]|uniref:Putative TetR family transcriptional regulator n=2 Tax=Nocardiaceae TaxID=85025 RepID=C0ZPE0_RHOE4|nr:TetR/AcrR family transcriptional regulator [Rhodococcus erythropolis]NRH31858.1 TetR/AcrR family transcriptional regulator [Rhodococcus sp. MS13]BAH35636.1 putative TetR family transcriptional regulator [Rhodococcus erythropolis PR4]